MKIEELSSPLINQNGYHKNTLTKERIGTPSQGDREGRALAVKGGKHRVGLLLQAGRHHFVEGSVIFDDKNRKHRAMYLSLVMAHNAAPPLVTRSVPRGK